MGIFKSFFKGVDSFGHPITLNFNKKGDKYTTAFGGVVTTLINIVLAYYFWVCFDVMRLRKGDTIEQVVDLTNYEDIGEISMKDAQVMPFIIIKDSRTFQNVEKLNLL